MNTETIIKNQDKVAAGFPSGPTNGRKIGNEGEQPEGQISFASELIRKGIHLASLAIPIGYFYVSKQIAIEVLLPFTVLSLLIDVGRHYVPAIHRVVAQLFDPILRPHERRAGLLSGATYVLISALSCVAIFPKIIAVTAFSILILSDSSSALFGRAFGRHRFLDKSLEGTFAFVITAWIVVAITPKAGPLSVEYLIGGIAAVVGGISEAASVRLRLDDNFSVPVSIGATMWGFYWLMATLEPASYGALYQALLHGA